MHKCKLLYQGKPLKNKEAKLHDIFNPDNETVNQVTVAYLNELESFGKDSVLNASKYSELIKTNIIAVVGVIALALIVLFVTFS